MRHITEDLLNQYLDRELKPDQRQWVEIHLAGCAECRANLAELVSVFVSLSDWSPASLPYDISQRVLAQLEPLPLKPVRTRPLIWVGLAVQLLVSGLLGFWLYPWLAGLSLPDLGQFDFSPLRQLVSDLGYWFGNLPGLIPAAGNVLPGLNLGNIGPVGWLSGVVVIGLGWLVLNRLLLKGSYRDVASSKEMVE